MIMLIRQAKQGLLKRGDFLATNSAMAVLDSIGDPPPTSPLPPLEVASPTSAASAPTASPTTARGGTFEPLLDDGFFALMKVIDVC